MRIGSKEYSRYLAQQLIAIRNYEKAKGHESYMLWVKQEIYIKRFVRSMAKEFSDKIWEDVFNETMRKL